MPTFFTSGFYIGTGGRTGMCNGIHMNTTSTSPVAISFRLWGDDPTSNPRYVSLQSGQYMEGKFRWINYIEPAGSPGTTLIGLL